MTNRTSFVSLFYKSMLFVVILCATAAGTHAQTGGAKLYNPAANAEGEISTAVKQAKAGKKHVLIQAGGNWCSWCLEFNRFTHADQQIDSLLEADYIVYHMNYSPENKNTALMTKFGFPQRFGFPVFIILDENGNQLHTQNSAYLEQGKSYNKARVMEFLRGWNRTAINPALYKNL